MSPGKILFQPETSSDYEYCLSKKTEPNCKLQFSVHILVAVLVCNFIKSALMLWTFWYRREETLVTFGDAIASWLDNPDRLTRGDCLMSKDCASREFLRKRARVNQDSEGISTVARRIRGVRFWGAAVSIKRWATTIAICAAAIGTTAQLLRMVTNKYYSDLTEAIASGNFGTVDPNLILETNLPTHGAGGLIAATLVTNSPQLILSFCYMLYNALFTYMHLAYEFSAFAVQRKSLRVTTARGKQRSTYWLQLPYTYALPLILASAVLHWLISQSIFLARITDVVDEVGYGDLPLPETLTQHPSNLGISVAPILACIVLASLMLLAVIATGFRKLKSEMPVASSCSFALAAATHRPKDDHDAAVLPIKWGEIPTDGSEDVGHCCFTSQDVIDVLLRKKYA